MPWRLEFYYMLNIAVSTKEYNVAFKLLDVCHDSHTWHGVKPTYICIDGSRGCLASCFNIRAPSGPVQEWPALPHPTKAFYSVKYSVTKYLIWTVEAVCMCVCMCVCVDELIGHRIALYDMGLIGECPCGTYRHEARGRVSVCASLATCCGLYLDRSSNGR